MPETAADIQDAFTFDFGKEGRQDLLSDKPHLVFRKNGILCPVRIKVGVGEDRIDLRAVYGHKAPHVNSFLTRFDEFNDRDPGVSAKATGPFFLALRVFQVKRGMDNDIVGICRTKISGEGFGSVKANFTYTVPEKWEYPQAFGIDTV